MDFIILQPEKEVFEIEQLFSFYIGGHGDWRSLVGRYQGNINDPEFALKLDRVRARLMLRNVRHYQSVSPITMKEVKRMNDLERWQRKASRVFNEFHRRVDAVRNDLFFRDKLQELCEDYKKTVGILKERYGIE